MGGRCVTPSYAVGVWVGNADGEGRPGLTGTETAAPILFDIFSLLPHRLMVSETTVELEEVANMQSEWSAGIEWCTTTDTLMIAKPGLRTTACTYHKLIHLSADRKFQASRRLRATRQDHFRELVCVATRARVLLSNPSYQLPFSASIP